MSGGEERLSEMTVEEIRRVLRMVCLERMAALREGRMHPDQEETFTTSESNGAVKPSPKRTTLTFAGFSFEEQRRVEEYAETLINEAHALCMRLQARCPRLRDDDNSELWKLERIYKAQYHAMARLRRRCNEAVWIRAHIRRARRWLEQPQMESVI